MQPLGRFASVSRAVVTIAATLSAATAFGQQPDANRGWKRIDRAADAAAQTRPDSIARQRLLWQLLDSAVLSALDRSISIDSINRILARRHQYQGPTPGQMTLQTPAASFWRQLPREAPSLYVAALGTDIPSVFLGVFQIERMWGNGPSHLTVYSPVGDRWQRTAVISSDREIYVYRIPSDGGPITLATVETWQRADGNESELKFWRLDSGRLRRVARADTARLQDLGVECTDSALILRSAQFPRHVSACPMCTRLMHEDLLTSVGGRVREQVVSATPWADLVDAFYGYLAAGHAGAAQRLLSPSLHASDFTGADPEFQSDTGDFERGFGTAVVLVASRDCGRTLQFESRRQSDGHWRIVAVDGGRWDWDRHVFLKEQGHGQDRCK